jgi:hypothetical protein
MLKEPKNGKGEKQRIQRRDGIVMSRVELAIQERKVASLFRGRDE